MRGVYTSTYLGELADAFARKRRVPALDIGKGFDLIVGTSTGGIVACALAAGVPLREVVSLYQEHGSAIFPTKLPTRPGLALIAQLFTRPAALASGAKALREVLEARFGSETLEEVYTRRRQRYFANASLEASVRESAHRLNGFVLIVVGTLSAPDGLHVSVNDGNRTFTLRVSGIGPAALVDRTP